MRIDIEIRVIGMPQPTELLTRSFSGVSFVEQGDLTTCRVENLYQFQSKPRLRDRFRRASNVRDRGFIAPLQGEGRDAEESAASLLDRMLSHRAPTALLHVPKQVDAHTIDAGTKYVWVGHTDHMHEHGSPELLDFAYVMGFDPLRGLVVVSPENLEDYHVHLTPEDAFRSGP